MKQILLVLAAVGVQLAFATKLPTYFEKCSQKDPKFGECVLRSAEKALKPLMQGDPEVGLPALLPMKLEPMHLNVTETLQFNLTNGLSVVDDDLTLAAVEFDFKKKTLFFSMKTSHAHWYVDYEATGMVLNKPLHEKGKANITFDELVANVTVTLDFKTVNGKKYLEATNCDATTFSKYDFSPYSKETVGEPLSDEQQKEMPALYEKSGLAIRQEARNLSNHLVLAELTKIFKLEPFDEMFLP